MSSVETRETAQKEPQPRVWPATALNGAQQPSWLAKKRLPRSAVTILIGDEGIGKSLLWVWIVAAVTTGRALPGFGIPARNPEFVIIIITEDEWSHTVRPRLEVAGADLTKIGVICVEKDGSGSPIFPRDMSLIVNANPAPGLVVVDAFVDTVDGNLSLRDTQQARLALHPWKEAATVTGAAVMLLTHTNRVDSKNPRDRYGATAELRKKARMTLYAQQDDEENLVVGPEKSNITGRVAASRFTIDAIPYFPATEDDDGTIPQLRYLGESQLSAREHLEENYETQHGESGEDDRSAVQSFLLDFLSNADAMEATAAVVMKAGRAAGFTDQEIKDGRRRCKRPKIVSRKSGFGSGWVWAIEHESAQGGEGGRVSDGATFATFVPPSTFMPPSTMISRRTSMSVHEGGTQGGEGGEGGTSQTHATFTPPSTTGPAEPRLCRVCGSELHPALKADVHPNCEEVAA